METEPEPAEEIQTEETETTETEKTRHVTVTLEPVGAGAEVQKGKEGE